MKSKIVIHNSHSKILQSTRKHRYKKKAGTLDEFESASKHLIKQVCLYLFIEKLLAHCRILLYIKMYASSMSIAVVDMCLKLR